MAASNEMSRMTLQVPTKVGMPKAAYTRTQSKRRPLFTKKLPS